MKVWFADDVETYADAATAFLERDPVRCNVPLSVIANRRAGVTDALHGSWVTDANGSVVGAASWTPPFQLLLSPMPEAAALAIADAWAPSYDRGLTGLVGPDAVVRPCAQRLAELTGRQPRSKFAERLFRLDAVVEPPQPGGGARPAGDADIELSATWVNAFVDEAGVTRGHDPEREVRASVNSGRLYLWEVDGRVVSLTGTGPSVARVTRLGPVYTPPAERGQGFARALVAAVSKDRLAAGDEACCLFTDLANPVSNAIYQQVGYQAVGDYAQVDLVST